MLMNAADRKVVRSNDNANERGRIGRQQLVIAGLIVLVLAPCADLAVWLAHHPSVAGYIKAWASGKQGTDSWYPMAAAMEFFHHHPTGRIFQQVFFVDGVKFQYPLTSLLIHEGLWMLGVTPSDAAFNRVNWWLILGNATAAGAFAFALARRYPEYARYRFPIAGVAAIGTFCFFPVVDAYYLGQVQVWINAVFPLAALAWLTGRKGIAGALVGAICMLKPQFGLFLIWGLLRREWRFIAGWAVVVLPGFALALGVFGLQNNLDYIPVLRALSRTGEVFVDNQSVNGFLNGLFASGDTANAIIVADVDPNACSLQSIRINSKLPPFHLLVYGGTLLTSALMICTALFVPKRTHGKSSVVDFVGAALVFTMASPVAWLHHYGILPAIFIAVTFTLLSDATRPGKAFVMTVLASSYLITAHWMGESWTFFGALALLAVIYGHLLQQRLSGRMMERETVKSRSGLQNI